MTYNFNAKTKLQYNLGVTNLHRFSINCDGVVTDFIFDTDDNSFYPLTKSMKDVKVSIEGLIAKCKQLVCIAIRR